MRGIAALFLGISITLAGGSVAAGPVIREYEDAVVITENDRPVLRITMQRDGRGGHTQLRLATLYDPYGEPYLDPAGEAGPVAALDWGVAECRIGGGTQGSYIADSPHRIFERWTRGAATEDRAELSMQRAWLHPGGSQAVALETAELTFHAQQYYRRAIDIHVRVVNVGTEPITLSSAPAFLVRFDARRPQAGFRTPENDYRSPPFRYRGPWLSGSSMSLARMKMMGVALFNAVGRGRGEAEFVAHRDGTLEMRAATGAATIPAGESIEWSTRLFCYADRLPARAIQDSYLGFLTGRTW